MHSTHTHTHTQAKYLAVAKWSHWCTGVPGHYSGTKSQCWQIHLGEGWYATGRTVIVLHSQTTISPPLFICHVIGWRDRVWWSAIDNLNFHQNSVDLISLASRTLSWQNVNFTAKLQTVASSVSPAKTAELFSGTKSYGNCFTTNTIFSMVLHQALSSRPMTSQIKRRSNTAVWLCRLAPRWWCGHLKFHLDHTH